VSEVWDIRLNYKNLSIFTFINIIFGITLILAIAFLSFYIKIDKQQYQQTQVQRYELIAKSFISKLPTIRNNQQLITLEKKLNLSIVTSKKIKLDILKKSIIIYQKEYRYTRIRAFKYIKNNYIYIQNLGFNLMLKDKTKLEYNILDIVLIAFFILSAIIFLYIMIYNKLKPLKELNHKIKQFSKGDFNTQIKTYSKDEIGQIGTTFNEAIKNTSYLIESKILFMRNIMHELKTPITKSLFLVNMINTTNIEDKQELEQCLYDMDTILKQLANIEKYQTQFTNIVKEKLNLKDMIKQTQDIKLIEHKHCLLIANKELMTIVFKNLIDNGLKYSLDKKIIIEIYEHKIIFKSKGTKLQKDLKYYTQPFTQSKKNNQGFGLGLYIVSQILNLHQLEFNYKYIDKYNSFCICTHRKSKIKKEIK
jgi:two-component system OmpR family sensor kinase